MLCFWCFKRFHKLTFKGEKKQGKEQSSCSSVPSGDWFTFHQVSTLADLWSLDVIVRGLLVLQSPWEGILQAPQGSIPNPPHMVSWVNVSRFIFRAVKSVQEKESISSHGHARYIVYSFSWHNEKIQHAIIMRWLFCLFLKARWDKHIRAKTVTVKVVGRLSKNQMAFMIISGMTFFLT